MINKLNCVVILLPIVQTIMDQLVEDFNSFQFSSNSWLCLNTGNQALIFQCSYGMSLVQLSFDCSQIEKIIYNIPPHSDIQLYVDIYPYSSIDGGEIASISIDSTQIYSLFTYLAGLLNYENLCSSPGYTFSATTAIIDIPHSSNSLKIDFFTNLDEHFPNEGYPFRNLQIFYKRCYKTCKTCSSDAQNGCLTCFTQNPTPVNLECNTCQNQLNMNFLHYNLGCIQECPNGYMYTYEYICEQAQNLTFVAQYNMMQPIFTQDLLLSSTLVLIRNFISCGSLQYLSYYQNEMLSKDLTLSSSSVSLRIRATLSFFGIWNSNQQIKISLNNQIISQIILNNLIATIQNGIILYIDQSYQACIGISLIQVRVEINQVITNNIQNIQFQGVSILDNTKSWSVTNIIIESTQCSLNCITCKSQWECNQCQISYFIYKGQCILKCPHYSDLIGNYCIDLDEEVIIPINSKSKYLMKEFYDLSTTNDRVNQLFTIMSSNGNNFAKGAGIYFSYLPNKRVFGGPLIWLNAQFLFQIGLPLYFYKIRIKFQVVLGDNFDTGIFQYQINNQNIVTLDKNSLNPILNSQLWGDYYNEYVLQVDEYQYFSQFNEHNLKILFTCSNPTKLINQAFCAIQNFFITTIYYCPNEYIFDYYLYYNNLYPCKPICGDGIKVDYEECDDGNYLPYDGCYNCKFECDYTCLFCLYGECLLNDLDQNDLDIFSSLNETILIYDRQVEQKQYILNCELECDEQNNLPSARCYYCYQQCNESCIFCLFGECLLDNLNKNDLDIFSSLNETIQIQDSKIQIQQQQQQQQLQDCQLECEICKDNNCFKCYDGYYLNIDFYCYNICGDSKIIGQEQCDDGNNNEYDGCINCELIKYELCDQYCSFCYNGKCIKCNYGYSLDNNQCLQICGDNLVNQEQIDEQYLEECDNVNSDGCINCKIQQGYSCIKQDQSICWTCDDKCVLCIKNGEFLECKQCIEGYFPFGSDCLKCDDNCITCKDESEICTSCYRDDCQLCEDIPGLYTDRQQKKCVTQCGDGIKVQYFEQCDDGNLDEGDGCDSECNLEYYDLVSQIQAVRYNGDKSNDIKIDVDNNVQLQCTNLTITIEGFSEQEFDFNSTSQDSNCQINFKFYKSITKQNLIHIIIQYQQIYSRLLINLESKELTVTPVDQVILDEGQQSQADAIASAQSSFSLLLWILAPLSILFGLFDYLWSILEVLSWINNFYFLNVQYPFNVQILFLNSDWSSLVNFPTYNELNQPDCEYYVQSPQRFQDKNVDPLFINNVQVPFFFIMTSVILYVISYIILLFFELLNKLCTRKQVQSLNPINIYNLQSQQESQQPEIQIQIYQNKYIQMIVKILNKVSQEFFSKIKQTITLCSLDITMAITLQLVYATNYQYFIIFINTVLALLFSLLLLHQLNQTYYVTGIHKELAEFPYFEQRYGCYYENLNIENSFSFKFNFIALIRKISYIFFTVYFYYQPFLQTTFCFLSCVTGVLLFFYSNPFETKGELIKAIISEGGLSIIVLITVIFSIDDQINQLTDEFKITLGWIIISIVCLCVLSEILTLLFEIMKFLYENISSFFISICKKGKQIEKKNKENQEIQQQQQYQKQSIFQNQLKPKFKPVNGKLHFLPKV